MKPTSWRRQTRSDNDTSGDTLMVRRSLVVGAALYGLLGAVWGSIYLVLGLTIPALIPYSYVVFALIVLVFYRVSGPVCRDEDGDPPRMDGPAPGSAAESRWLHLG